MQTFLPYSDFDGSIECLDKRRLIKQVTECCQIIDALHGKTAGWINHPAVKMWAGYESALYEYLSIAVSTARGDGFRFGVYVSEHMDTYASLLNHTVEYPIWLDGPIHHTHQANLWRKGFQESLVAFLRPTVSPFVSGKRYGYSDYLGVMSKYRVDDSGLAWIEDRNHYAEFNFSFGNKEWDIDYHWPTKEM